MYFYIIDNFIKERQHAKSYHRMSMYLNDLGIFDDKIQVTKVRPIEDIVHDVLSNKNIKQIIAVGNDSTASKIINAICKYPEQENMPAFGIIPFTNSNIAESLGFPTNIEESCNMISRRKIDKIDIGKANKDFFLNSLRIRQNTITNQTTLDKIKTFFQKDNNTARAEIELVMNNYKIISSAEHVDIININNNFWKRQLSCHDIDQKKISPYDGLANILISGNLQKDSDCFSDLSFFTAKNINIKSNDKFFAYLDNTIKTKPPIEITIKMKYFNTLLGKNRNF